MPFLNDLIENDNKKSNQKSLNKNIFNFKNCSTPKNVDECCYNEKVISDVENVVVSIIDNINEDDNRKNYEMIGMISPPSLNDISTVVNELDKNDELTKNNDIIVNEIVNKDIENSDNDNNLINGSINNDIENSDNDSDVINEMINNDIHTSNIETDDVEPKNSNVVNSSSHDYKNNKLMKLFFFLDDISQSLLHTFLLSVFETAFFWIYVTKQEKTALLNKISKIEYVMNFICLSINSSDIENIISVVSSEFSDTRKEDNKIPYEISLYLNFILFALTIAMYLITYRLHTILVSTYKNNTISKNNICSIVYYLINPIKKSLPLFLFISIYETLFFKLVIREYEPLSSNEFMMKLLKTCL